MITTLCHDLWRQPPYEVLLIFTVHMPDLVPHELRAGQIYSQPPSQIDKPQLA
ncbi:hypothetical protein FVEN_g12996 [Fusarium venenatum]|nr:hypothetical protein FVEN_g12996 [Fusarium venenatum]